jgi:class 3 adenylate cyclase/pimeloyl-ACP methyl ester carboxylesterase
MEPRIQYAKTSDGVSIAYYAIGQGEPLVVTPGNTLSHIQLEWQVDECRGWYERLAEKRMVVRYDARGSGLSDRDACDFSVDAQVRDLEAVVDRIQPQRIALIASIDLGPAAIAYAVRNPERVSALILWCTYASGADLETAPETQAWIGLMDTEWQLGTESWAANMVGWSESELARRLAAVWRESCARETLVAYWRASLGFNVDELLPLVRTPTLILHRREIRWLTVDSARRLASRIPNARLTILEGPASMPFVGDSEVVASAIEEFLGVVREPVLAQPASASAMTAILFADIVDSTSLTERLGDAAFRGKARELDGALRSIIRERGGTPIEGKLLGDGVLATFASARQAIEAALACASAGSDATLPLHLGLHAGDVIREENNVYGGAVNIAARISGLSAPGEVLVSETVRSLARTSAGVTFEDRGEQALKGVGEAVRVWAVVASPNQQTAEPANQGE